MLSWMQTEAGVSLQLQDYKAISQRADLCPESINHIPDYSAGGNGVCIVSPRQMYAPGKIDLISRAKERQPKCTHTGTHTPPLRQGLKPKTASPPFTFLFHYAPKLSRFCHALPPFPPFSSLACSISFKVAISITSPWLNQLKVAEQFQKLLQSCLQTGLFAEKELCVIFNTFLCVCVKFCEVSAVTNKHNKCTFVEQKNVFVFSIWVTFLKFHISKNGWYISVTIGCNEILKCSFILLKKHRGAKNPPKVVFLLLIWATVSMVVEYLGLWPHSEMILTSVLLAG